MEIQFVGNTFSGIRYVLGSTERFMQCRMEIPRYVHLFFATNFGILPKNPPYKQALKNLSLKKIMKI
jgi:hypothetical protein